MLKFSALCLASFLFISSCKDGKPTDNANTDGKSGKDPVAADVNQIKQAPADMEKTKEELTKLAPLSLDKLKALIPEVLMGAPRMNHEANTSSGAGLASGEYTLTDSSSIILNVFDCSGPGGAGIYTLQFGSLENAQVSTAEEYTKKIEINGGQGFEHCDATSNDCTITYFSGNRFLVVLEGSNVNASKLKELVKELKIN